MRFVDSNVLLYAAGTDASEQHKREIALEILRSTDLAISVQVLQEFYVQATRPTRRDRLSHEQASQLVEAFLRFKTQPMTVEILTAALAASQRFRIGYWDAAILEAARALGCSTVISEDFSHGRDHDGVRTENPFR